MYETRRNINVDVGIFSGGERIEELPDSLWLQDMLSVRLDGVGSWGKLSFRKNTNPGWFHRKII